MSNRGEGSIRPSLHRNPRQGLWERTISEKDGEPVDVDQSSGVFFNTLEHGAPVIRGTFVAIRVRLSRAPDVPVAFRVIFARS